MRFTVRIGGCDSVILLDLRVMEPMADILPPGQLDCDSAAVLVLDGNQSSINAVTGGTTSYVWNGPQDGFLGPMDEAATIVNKPGMYGLQIHESNGVSCSDNVCVQVETCRTARKPVIQRQFDCVSRRHRDVATNGWRWCAADRISMVI